MNHDAASASHDVNDSDILKILLSLSDSRPPDWEPQFPFLDAYTVSQVSHSISFTLFKGNSELNKLIVVRSSSIYLIVL